MGCYFTFNTVPAEILEPLDKPLSCNNSLKVMPLLTAIRYRLSPDLTVYVPVAEADELATLLDVDATLLL